MAGQGATFILRTERDRQFALKYVQTSPFGLQVKVGKPNRTEKQNRHLHALLGDIAAQLPWPQDTGEIHDIEWWKRATTLQWLIDAKSQPDLIGSLDGLQFAMLLPHTSDLTTAQLALYIEWLYAFGAQSGVTFKEAPHD